jgi:hypothetical protein
MEPRHRLGDNPSLACTRDNGMAELPMRGQPNKAAINNTTTTAARGNGPQIRNMVIGFAPALWLLKHRNIQLNGKMSEP